MPDPSSPRGPTYFLGTRSEEIPQVSWTVSTTSLRLQLLAAILRGKEFREANLLWGGCCSVNRGPSMVTDCPRRADTWSQWPQEQIGGHNSWLPWFCRPLKDYNLRAKPRPHLSQDIPVTCLPWLLSSPSFLWVTPLSPEATGEILGVGTSVDVKGSSACLRSVRCFLAKQVSTCVPVWWGSEQ
jgi:hypothetical protein